MEQTTLFNREQAARNQALEEQAQAIQLAKSPGDYATWWNLLHQQGQPTASDFANFQRSGARAGLYPEMNIFQQQRPATSGQAQAQMQQQQGIDPTPQDVMFQANEAIRAGQFEGASPAQAEMLKQFWADKLSRAYEAQNAANAPPLQNWTFASASPGFVPEREAEQIAGQVPTTTYRSQAPLSLASPGNISPGMAMSGATPNWMAMLFGNGPSRIGFQEDIQAQRPTAPRRTIANVAGVNLPSAQTFNRLVPSAQQGYLGSVAPGVPRTDLEDEFFRTTRGFPNMPRRFLFRPQGSL